jgi:hypothetical protein
MDFFIGLVIGILIGVLALATICGSASAITPSRRNKAAMIREKNRIMEIHRNSGW